MDYSPGETWTDGCASCQCYESGGFGCVCRRDANILKRGEYSLGENNRKPIHLWGKRHFWPRKCLTMPVKNLITPRSCSQLFFTLHVKDLRGKEIWQGLRRIKSWLSLVGLILMPFSSNKDYKLEHVQVSTLKNVLN